MRDVFLSPITGTSLSQEILNRVCPERGAIAASKAAAERTESTPIESLLGVGGFRIGTQTLFATGGLTSRVKDTTSRYWIGIKNERRRDPGAEKSGHQFSPTAICFNLAYGPVTYQSTVNSCRIRTSELRLSDKYFLQLLDEFGKAESALKSK